MTDAERTIDTSGDPAAPAPESTGKNSAAKDSAESGPGGPHPVRRTGVLACVAVIAYLLDLVTKIVAVEWLEHRAPVEIVGEWLRLELVRNSGAAFGMGQTLTVALTCIAAIVVVVILRLARKLYSGPWALALGLLLGGALGNLTDRIFRAPSVFEGAVVDFLSPKHFAVFNIADSAIVCGGILIVILSFRGLDPDGTVHRDDDEESSSTEPAEAGAMSSTDDAKDDAHTDRAARDGEESGDHRRAAESIAEGESRDLVSPGNDVHDDTGGAPGERNP